MSRSVIVDYGSGDDGPDCDQGMYLDQSECLLLEILGPTDVQLGVLLPGSVVLDLW